MKYDELILACIECIQTFNPSIEGPDSFAEKFLKTKTKDSNERMFIKQVFYGVLRYIEFLKVFTENLFRLNPSSTERKDETLYHIFCYITVFRLDELPLDDYRQLIYSQDSVKMNEFFKFIFNPDILNNVLRQPWLELFDFNYIDNKVIGALITNSEVLNDLITHVMNKAEVGILPTQEKTRKVDSSKGKRKPIVAEPFNLSQPKPKVIQEPMKIYNKFVTTPVPLEEYKKVGSLEEMDKKRKERLEVIKENIFKKYEQTKHFEFETEKRPMNFEKIKEEVNNKINETLKFNEKYHNPLKDYSKNKVDIKYNETAILREEMMINRKKKQEEDELNKRIIEKKDSDEFERWKREMEERDNILRNQEILKRKLELEMNRAVATDYYNQRLMQNKLEAAKHKEEEMKKLKQKQEELIQELEEKKKLVKEIDKEKDIIIAEKEKQIEANKALYAQRLSEYKELILKAKEEQRIEDEKRKDIIRQIRELEKLPVKRTKGFDPTETPGYGLLEEMSIAELKERLEIQQKFHQEWVESKKEENKLRMEEKSDILTEKTNFVFSHREKMKISKENERQVKKENKRIKEEKEKEIRERNLIEVTKKIEKKKKKMKQEEEIFQKKIREFTLQKQYLQQAKVVMEEKTKKDIEAGIQRRTKDKRDKELMEEQSSEAVKWGEINLRYNSAKNDVKGKTALVGAYDRIVEETKGINSICVEEDLAYKKTVHERVRKLEGIQKTKINERNKFSDGLQQMSLKMTTTANSHVNSHSHSNTQSHKLGSKVHSPMQSASFENENEPNPIMNKLEKEKI